jgi:2-amino-4-hydroxy-6-hydroxymethyldihydropteridine diphosphokinase/dihydropteroate synthase
MVILGLGSNVGDRLAILRQALLLIKVIPNLTVQQVSPVYISEALMPEHAPASWNKPYLNLAVRCETDLNPHELLAATKNIEIQLGRTPSDTWAPRPVDIDILAWDDLVQKDDKLHIPHEHLHLRPFALWPLADVAPRWVYPLENIFCNQTAAAIATQWPSRFSGNAPLRTRQIAQRIDTPQLVGILNITPDSFSDGNAFSHVNAVIEQAYHLVESGADILDIGAEATSPKAAAIDPATEWQRLEPVLIGILAQSTNMLITPKISIDTRNPMVAAKALALGVDWINDVSGLSDPAMCDIITAQSCDVVVMHSLGIPSDPSCVLPLAENPTTTLYQWAEQNLKRLEKLGITSQRVILDYGLGFGKNAEQSLELLQNMAAFHSLNTRLLVGHSRKSFLQQFTPLPPAERDIETLAISLYLADHGIDYLRLHQIEMCARAFKVTKALKP